MMPLLPTHTVEYHASDPDHLAGRSRHVVRLHDPDGFLGDDALQPDPLYMAFRRLGSTRSFAAIRRWLQARAERHGEPAGVDALEWNDREQLPAPHAPST